MWEPLPLILYGYAVHPLTASRRDTRFSTRTRDTEASSIDDHFVYKDVVSLEVGDEIYAFERYMPRGKEVDGVWYRGYVVCTARRPPVHWPSASDTAAVKAALRIEEPQQVFMGLFPASHIHIRDELSDAEGRLPLSASAGSTPVNGASESNSIWNRERSPMYPLKEEDEADKYSVSTSRKSFRLALPPDQAGVSRGGLPVYSASTSIRSPSPTDTAETKPLPPRPSLKSGDDTASGQNQPIVDEIASALREWHSLMFQYLARRDYKLFRIVQEHTEALHLGRRQLLAQSLSAEETVNLRRECVLRLVTGNLVQGLDVVVRHPTWGGLATVNVDGDIDPRSWTSGVRMYAMQASLGHLSATLEDRGSRGLLASADPSSSSYLPPPAPSAFADTTLTSKSHTRSAIQDVAGEPKTTPSRFYHIFLDLRAFVATPCLPGETAELYFSLYRKSATPQFITEDFCAILNHNGVLSRDPAARIRTLFTDLAAADIQDPVYLVCRIVRNGSLKSGATSSSFPEVVRRGSEASAIDYGPSSPETPMSPVGIAAGKILHSADSNAHVRRPFGCAVWELTQLSSVLVDNSESSAMKECTMPIYVPTNELSFSMIHQNIINGNHRDFEKSPRADTLAVSVKVFRGDVGVTVKENPSLLYGIPHTLRLGFPDVVFPGNNRNELYVKLWCGDFASNHTSGGRLSVSNFTRGQMGPQSNSVEVCVEVRDVDGLLVDAVVSQGSGDRMSSQFRSLVFPKCNEPTYGEMLKVQLPPDDGIPHWHLFFTFRNRSTKDRSIKDGPEKPFAFAFLPLFPDRRAFVEDGSHSLITFKADKLSQLTATQYLSCPSWLTPGQRPEHVTVGPDMQRLAAPLRDTLTVRTSLCSTKFTHNSILLSLLNWEQIADRELLSTVLAKFTYIGEGEIVKFLPDIFNALFGILVSPNNGAGDLDRLVFNALVAVLSIVQDRRFINFQSVLDVYIEEHFTCAAAPSHLMHSMNRLLSSPAAPENASQLRSTLKVWHYIVKFIARSRELQRAREVGMGGGATAEHLESSFKRELRSNLMEVTKMMSSASPGIIGTQTLALQNFTTILPELARIFTTVELVTIVTSFSTNAAVVGKGTIVIWKLIMFLQIVKGFLFENAESRALLVESVAMWIKPHFGRYDEYVHLLTAENESSRDRDAARIAWLQSIRLCVSIVAVILDKLQQNLVNPAIIADKKAYRQEQDNVEQLLPLLPRLLDSYREMQNPESIRVMKQDRTTKSTLPVTFPESYPFSLLSVVGNPDGMTDGYTDHTSKTVIPALGETAAAILVLGLCSSNKHFFNFLDISLDIEGKDRFVALLTQFFRVSMSVLDNEAYPKTWLNINILAHKVLVKMMEPITTILEKAFIPEPDSVSQFDTALWNDAFTVLLKILSSDQLVIEEFSPQKRRAVWRLAGDLRGQGSTIMLQLWQALGAVEHSVMDGEILVRHGGYQTHLSGLVGQTVHLCLSHHEQLRSNAVQMLYSMIISTYQELGHFDGIEHELVTRLDHLFMSDSRGDDISGAFFVTQLRHMFDTPDVEEALKERVSAFLDSVEQFLELLHNVRALPEGDEFADERVIATLRLMNFIRVIGRDEIYIKYVHELVNMHLQSQNYVEAAFTLKLHADLYRWEVNSFVPPMDDLGLPQQSQFHRKETLCLLVLDYLGKGKAWESAIEICKELSRQHAETTYNYGRLSEILKHQATLLEHIVTEQRYYPDYYLVTFYGNFPSALRDKRFIYRGYEWEKFGAFCERMLNKHPGAQLLKMVGDPPVDIRFGNDQYLQCTAVTPEPDKTAPIFVNRDVPSSVRAYYEHSAIQLFSSSRQIHKQARDSSEETWTEKIYYTTEEVFPTVLRRSQVVNMQTLEISPVEAALEEVLHKTNELTGLWERYDALSKTSQQATTNPLAMSLNNAVDTPINTGIPAFRQTFFNPDYLARNPDRVDVVEKLKAAIDAQVQVIDNCLKLHGSLCPAEFLPFHETLEKFFKKNFYDEIRRLGIEFPSDTMTISPSVRSGNLSREPSAPSLTSSYEPSISRSMTIRSSASVRRQPVAIPALQFGRPLLTPPPPSPTGSPTSPTSTSAPPQTQTLLQRHLAYLTRHGINGVSSAPGDAVGSDTVSVASPRNSFVNVGGTHVLHANGMQSTPAVQVSGNSVMGYNVGSVNSLGSISGTIRGRISRFGSLNFGRQRRS